jgi:hypothetical protein
VDVHKLVLLLLKALLFCVGKLANLTINLIQKIKTRKLIEAKFMTKFDLA